MFAGPELGEHPQGRGGPKRELTRAKPQRAKQAHCDVLGGAGASTRRLERDQVTASTARPYIHLLYIVAGTRGRLPRIVNDASSTPTATISNDELGLRLLGEPDLERYNPLDGERARRSRKHDIHDDGKDREGNPRHDHDPLAQQQERYEAKQDHKRELAAQRDVEEHGTARSARHWHGVEYRGQDVVHCDALEFRLGAQRDAVAEG